MLGRFVGLFVICLFIPFYFILFQIIGRVVGHARWLMGAQAGCRQLRPSFILFYFYCGCVVSEHSDVSWVVRHARGLVGARAVVSSVEAKGFLFCLFYFILFYFLSVLSFRALRYEWGRQTRS